MQSYTVKVNIVTEVFDADGAKVFARTDHQEFESNDLFTFGAGNIPGMKDALETKGPQ
jgi:hypothetical protein